MPDSSIADFAANFVPLTEVTRGGVVESIHAGAVAVVDRDGKLLYGAGNATAPTFARSALKPLQALPFVAAGGVERFGLTSAEVALLCASHSGEDRHAIGVAAILAKAGNREQELQCGTQPPGHYAVRGEVPPPPPYSPLFHNCSGKHAGMLAHCVACGYDKHNYLDPGHPLQVEVRRAVARFAAVPIDSLAEGIDGCSAPTYAIPLASLAQAYARLATVEFDAVYGDAPRRLAEAMLARPDMVSGEGRLDLALAAAGHGDWLAKSGAEGVIAIGVRSRGWGIAVKIADGSPRGLQPAIVAVLEQLGLLDAVGRSVLASFAAPVQRNHRQLSTGSARAVVVLDKTA